MSREPYGTLTKFQRLHSKLAGRVQTWVFRRFALAKPRRADKDALSMPDAASVAEFCKETGVTADWLLGLVGDVDAPQYRDQQRTDAALAGDLAAYLARGLKPFLAGQSTGEAAWFGEHWKDVPPPFSVLELSGEGGLSVLADTARSEARALINAQAEWLDAMGEVLGRTQPTNLLESDDEWLPAEQISAESLRELRRAVASALTKMPETRVVIGRPSRSAKSADDVKSILSLGPDSAE